MELSWVTKIKILFVFVIGAGLLGFQAWPLLAPANPMSPVSLAALTGAGFPVLAVLSFVAGFLAYFAAWPLGREIAILAVPAGLGFIGIRSGSMQAWMQATPDIEGRQAIYSALRWEPFFWLVLVGLGYLGVVVAARLRPSKPNTIPEIHHETRHKTYAQGVLGIALSMFVALILIGAFARNTPLAHASIATQPRDSQLVFALCVAFAGAAFVTRTVLKVGIVWTLASIPLLYGLGTWAYASGTLLGRVTSGLPATSYPHALMAALPIQMVAFGTIGTVIGYWLAIRYHFWRRHEFA